MLFLLNKYLINLLMVNVPIEMLAFRIQHGFQKIHD
jgi:hypothetical protein